MPLQEFFSWLAQQPIAQEISGSWMFPFFESIHVVGLAMLIGSIGLLDLRLLRVAVRERPITVLAKQVIPWSWAGFGIALTTGLLIFAGSADRYAENPAFLVKMALIVLAGANMFLFHNFTWRGVGAWDVGETTVAAKTAGALSLLFWCGVVFAGRYIAFV